MRTPQYDNTPGTENLASFSRNAKIKITCAPRFLSLTRAVSQNVAAAAGGVARELVFERDARDAGKGRSHRKVRSWSRARACLKNKRERGTGGKIIVS